MYYAWLTKVQRTKTQHNKHAVIIFVLFYVINNLVGILVFYPIQYQSSPYLTDNR